MILNLQTSETKLKRETMTQMSCKMQRVFSGAWASSCDALPRFITLFIDIRNNYLFLLYTYS